MSEPVTIEVIGDPKPQGSKRLVRNKWTGVQALIEDNPGVRAWRKTVKAAAQAAYSGRPMVGPVTVDLTFRFTRPKTIQDRRYPCVPPDVDKTSRAVLDALTKVVFVDDAQVVGLIARKLYAETLPPGVTIIVKQVE